MRHMSERWKEQVGRLFKPALGFGMPPEGSSLMLVEGSLNQRQIMSVLENAGRDLTRIHATTGEGYGWINPLRAVITRRFVGKHGSWYEFLLAFYDQQTQTLDKIFADEKETGQYHTPLSRENREQLEYLHNQRPLVRSIFEKKRTLLSNVSPQLLHGNLFIGSVFVRLDGSYAGLGDFTQMLLGDPVDDLAYFSVMPEGNVLLPTLQQGWKDVTGEMDIEEKIHLYRLWQSYRKTYTRYVKHRYLDRYPEPLAIGREEIDNLK